MRCVEAWSMVIPWLGFPLGDLIKRLEPTGNAQLRRVHHAARSGADARASARPILDWPYVEGLRLDEAMHPLTLMAVGLYGKMLPNQNGAPLRLVVPWKYGFKGIKSIVKIRFTAVSRRTPGPSPRRRSTAFTPTSIRRSIIRAGARPPSAASASSRAARRCRSTATPTRSPACTTAWTCARTSEQIAWRHPPRARATSSPARRSASRPDAWLKPGIFDRRPGAAGVDRRCAR